ncbi:MAG: hypothetical protein IPM97_04045 [Bdellovibrionaceae bacterium]|nr:hypothetical protein [Pseudobdellovibrionaceae bacterium]
MSEFFFVIKSLIITALLTILMQVKVGPSSLEQQAQAFLQKSSTAVYVQSVAAGGALALKKLYYSVKSSIVSTSTQAGK